MRERVAIYCRLSEEDREKDGPDSRSIQNQRALLRQYASDHDWEIVAEWIDDDWAGADRSRPGFRQLLYEAERGRYDIVLCKTQSRFTREIELVEHYLHDCFPRWGVRFVSVVDHADTAVRQNKKARQINGLINEWYLEDLSENIRAVLTSRRKSGLHIGSTALYGYQKDPDRRGHLLPDPLTAPVVQQIFIHYAAGWSQKAIADHLSTQGEPSPAARKGHGSKRWSPSTISSMLHNEMYRGTLVQGRYGSQSYKTRKNVARPQAYWYKVPDTHTPLISESLWDAVQQRLSRSSHPSQPADPSPLAGKVFCHLCGAPLCMTTTRGRRYLQCSTHHTTSNACPGAFISEAALRQAVLSQLNALLEDYRASLSTISPAQSENHMPIMEETRLRALEQHRRSLHLLYLDRAAGRISESEAQTLADRLQSDLERLCAPNQPSIPSTIPTPSYQPFPRLYRSTVQLLIDRILVGRRAPGSREVAVIIEWRF